MFNEGDAKDNSIKAALNKYSGCPERSKAKM